MEVDAGCRCVICSTPSRPAVELVRETFSASRTLEKTLEMLWGRISDSKKVDIKWVFEEMTGKIGSLFCFPCLAVLHAGMGLVSEIMQLEERLLRLIGRITATISYKEAIKVFQYQQTNRSCSTDDIPSRKLTLQQRPARQCRGTIPQRPKRDIDHTDDETKKMGEESQETASGLKETCKKRRHRQSNSSVGEEWKSNKSQSSKEKTLKKESVSSAVLQSKSGPEIQKCSTISGVQECPSCDYTVDVRTPEQAAKSSKSFTASVRALLVAKSRYKLATHYRDVHLSVSRTNRFTQISSSGKKVYKCVECSLKVTSMRAVLLHYISFHVRERPKPVTTGRSSVSCPEEGCSFVAVAGKPRWTKDSDRVLRNALSSHVIRHHDRLRSSAGKCPVNAPLIVETEDDNKEFHCTRCEFRNTYPENASENQRVYCRRIFLRHFFDVHLRDLISNQ